MSSMAYARPEPFEALYAAHFREIAAYIRRRVPPEDADDVTAQVFTVAWRKLGTVPDPPADRLWLYGVARNCVADAERAARRRRRLHDRLAAEAWPPAPSANPDPRLDHVRAALRTLRPREREALLLLLWDGLSQAEAAVVLQCSPGAVEHRYRRARAAIRAALGSARASGGPAPDGPAPDSPAPDGPAAGRAPAAHATARRSGAAAPIQPFPRTERR
jgi:RNA polymerase sigma-70 factor (ECF subfamily)